ncbi:MAG: hypothetical protein LBN74_10785 [Prevotella sp.]|jgi:hypothetical protein|nr:hypothetical protein [Prevotella sp.]
MNKKIATYFFGHTNKEDLKYIVTYGMSMFWAGFVYDTLSVVCARLCKRFCIDMWILLIIKVIVGLTLIGIVLLIMKKLFIEKKIRESDSN